MLSTKSSAPVLLRIPLFSNKDKDFLLICGFEMFENFIVRIDILEKLFIKIISKSVNNEFSISVDMLNLLGCGKEDFKKLLKLMNYIKVNNNNDVFKYNFKTKKDKNKKIEKKVFNNPFNQLKKLSLNS
jgi:ATP-dependent RNA helicase SUPV3L1/SUV3